MVYEIKDCPDNRWGFGAISDTRMTLVYNATS
jgi:hypothetical protein